MVQSFLKSPTIERLPNLLEQLRTGELRIPPFQREFVWDADQRLDLLDTIRRGLPAGTLMVWRTTRVLPTINPVGSFSLGLSKVPKGVTSQYLLDGQQRLTTLMAALGAALWTREGSEPPWDEKNRHFAPDGKPWAIGFDVGTPDGGFVLLWPDSTHHELKLLPLAILLDDVAFDDWREQVQPTREETNRARALRSSFIDYLLPIVPLATEEVGSVTLTFKRLNTGGTPMGEYHMARALSWNEDFDFDQHISDDIVDPLTTQGWEGANRDHLLKVIATAYGLDPVEIDFEKLSDHIKVDPDRLHQVGDALVWAVEQLRKLGFGGPAILPYVYMLVFAARVLLVSEGRVTPEKERKFMTWLAEACITERFSGGTPSHVIVAAWRELARELRLPNAATAAIRREKHIRPPFGRINFSWARPKVTAAIMALQNPMETSGFHEDAAAVRRLGQAGKDVFLPLLDAAEARDIQQKNLLASAANRVVCEAEYLMRLRQSLQRANCPKQLMAEHLITPESHAFLVEGNYDDFLLARAEEIRQAEQRWLAEWGSTLEIPAS